MTEGAVEVLEVAQVGERGRLVEDCVRPVGDDRLHDRVPVKQVEMARHGPKRSAPPGDLCVPALDRLRDEPRPGLTARAYDEDSRCLFSFATSPRFQGS